MPPLALPPLLLLLSVLLLAPSPCAGQFEAVWEGYSSTFFAGNLGKPRQLAVVPSTGDLLVLDASEGEILLLFDDDGDGSSGPSERVVLAAYQGLNHGLAYHPPFLFASTVAQVLRWTLDEAARTVKHASPEVYLHALPAPLSPSPWFSTRSLATIPGCTSSCRLFVHLGAGSNIDPSGERAAVRAFPLLPPGDPLLPLSFSSGELLGAGLRNAVSLAWERSSSSLWCLDSAPDGLNRTDLGPGYAEDNPAEELIRLEPKGAFHGYPYCWSSFSDGKQYAWDTLMNETLTDAWCRQPAHNTPPALTLQGHTSPLGLVFYDFHQYEGAQLPSTGEEDEGAFPKESPCRAFATFHGSIFREVETGYKVVCITFDEQSRPREYLDFFSYGGDADHSPEWIYRPVDLKVGKRGELYFSSDKAGTGLIVKITYTGGSAALHPSGLVAVLATCFLTCLAVAKMFP